MRITDKELDTLLKSGEAHSFDKRFNFRGAQENTGKNSNISCSNTSPFNKSFLIFILNGIFLCFS